MIYIGIDPGVKTGFAAWNSSTRQLLLVETIGIIDAMDSVRYCCPTPVTLVVEDARKRKWFGDTGREKLQGAGSVKRDCGIWQEFAESRGIKIDFVSPQAKGAKLDAAQFKRLTGWDERTSQHARDAAMLVFGR